MNILKKHDKNSIGLIGHTVIDYPDPATARAAIDIMVRNGVSLIECQIPFSEPVADGPTFMHANHEALAQGVTVKDCFAFMQEVTQKHDIPFVFMTYSNIVFARGYEKFVVDAKNVGAAGAIVPDLPVELSQEYLAICRQHDFATPQLLPPNADANRQKQLLAACNGFVYAVARSGVTGSQSNMNQQLITQLDNIRSKTELPIAVGFGIQQRSDVEFLKPHADYAIIGTKALRVLQQDGLTGLQDFWQAISA